jgi:hypothetical protein
MKIIELSAIYTMNFRIYCELVPVVDYKGNKDIIYIEMARAIFLIF